MSFPIAIACAYKVLDMPAAVQRNARNSAQWSSSLRHGVISMPSPRVTSENPFDSEIEALENPMFPECFKSILRACRSESACWRFQWGYAHLIESYQEDERGNQNLSDERKYLIFQYRLHLSV